MQDRSVFRFHINTLNEFKAFLIDRHMPETLFDWVTIRDYEPFLFDFKVKDMWTTRDYQAPYIDYLSQKKPVAKLLELQTGFGKMQPLDSRIKVPGGWARMGDMHVGREVIAKDGTTTKVTGVFPNGIKEIYKITFSDGRSTECGGEHLWKICVVDAQRKSHWNVVDTLEVLRLLSDGESKVYIDLIDSERNQDSVLPIDPYLLGAYLACGTMLGGVPSIKVTNKRIAESIKAALPTCLRIEQYGFHTTYSFHRILSKPDVVNEVTAGLKEVRLLNTHEYNNFIPQAYFHSSTTQRLALLQGLMDCSGDASSSIRGTARCNTASIELAMDIVYLVRSLGGVAYYRAKQNSFLFQGEEQLRIPTYTVDIRYKKIAELFTLKEKLRFIEIDKEFDDLKLQVMSVASIGHKPAQCISIEHYEQLYVTDEFIVTHNTYSAMRAIANVGERVVAVLKPKYIEKWEEDFRKTYEDFADKIVVVQGSKDLKALLILAAEDALDYPIILISNATYRNWITEYERVGEESKDLGYACLPEDLFLHLRAGVRLIDESHEDFHFFFKLDTYTHVRSSISLTATLIHKDPLITKMYDIQFPPADRMKKMDLERYVSATCVLYQFKSPEHIRTEEYGQSSYSHIVFEKSVTKHVPTLRNYFKLIKSVMDVGYIKDKQPGERAIVYAASVDMCTRITEFLKGCYPDLDVRRYVEQDPYENAIDADIRVTTILSGGTALDIPNLSMALMTTALDSVQGNIQALGRLRKREGKMQFYFLTAENLPKHMKYAEAKKILFQPRVKSYRSVAYGEPV